MTNDSTVNAMDDCGNRLGDQTPQPSIEQLLDSYRRLADLFRLLLSPGSLDHVLEQIANALRELVIYDALTIYRVDEAGTALRPVLARDRWAEEIMQTRVSFGQGITGWVALHQEPVWTNQAQLDPRVLTVPGTPSDEPEALICVPLLDAGHLLGTLNLYRLGEDAAFGAADFELACRFADAAALALAQADLRCRLEQEARTDALTGIANRRGFCEQLAADLLRADRTDERVGLLLVDIDDFKHVNDACGHGVGDQVLIALARALETCVRRGDLVARLGGEEFVVVLPDAEEDVVAMIGERILSAVGSIVVPSATSVTVSIGGAISHPCESADGLLEQADAALLRIKREGKNGLRLRDLAA